MNKRILRPSEVQRVAYAKRLLKRGLETYSLSYVARQARLNKSNLHRFMYADKKVRLETTERIVTTLRRLEKDRKAERTVRSG